MAKAYVGLGSNIGDRGTTLLEAVKMIDDIRGVSVMRISQFIKTEPVGGPPDQPPYLNAAAELDTNRKPEQLMAELLKIEAALGRDRSKEQRWGPRTCDLDLLLIDDLVMDTPTLTLPHPRMHERQFVLEPLASIAPEAVHSKLGKSVRDLLLEVMMK